MLVTQVCLAQPLRGPTGALLQPGFVRDLLCWVGPQTPGWSWEACEDPDPARCGAGARPGRAEVQCTCAPFPGAVPSPGAQGQVAALVPPLTLPLPTSGFSSSLLLGRCATPPQQ